jgi:hypothetical protein
LTPADRRVSSSNRVVSIDARCLAICHPTGKDIPMSFRAIPVVVVLSAALAAGALSWAPTSALALPGISIAQEQPPEKAGLTLTSGSITIETKEAKLTCESSEGSATMPTSTFAEGSLRLKGCTAFGSTCTAEGLKAGEIKLGLAIWVVLLTSEKEKGEVGLELGIASGKEKTSVPFKCSTKEVKLSGSFLTPALAKEKSKTEYPLEAKETKGVQSPLEYLEEGSGKKVKATLEMTNPLKKGEAEQAGLAGTEKAVFEESVKASTTVPVLNVPQLILFTMAEKQPEHLRNNSRLAAISVVSATMIEGTLTEREQFSPNLALACGALSPTGSCIMLLEFLAGATGLFDATNMELVANPGGKAFTTAKITAKR